MLIRSSFGFSSPNEAGLAIALVISTGAWMGILAAKSVNYYRMYMCVISFSAAVLFLGLLVCTGSRGASIACAFGLLPMFVYLRGHFSKHLTLIVSVIITACLLTIFIRCTDSGIDVSSIERLDVLQAHLGVISDYPLQGLRNDNPQKIIDLWYLPGIYSGRFGSPLNDTIELASRHGLVCLWVYICIILLAIYVAFSGIYSGHVLAGPAASCIVIISTAGNFQSFLHHYPWTLAVMASCIVFVFVTEILARIRRQPSSLSAAAILSTATISACLSGALWAGSVIFSNAPWRTSLIDGELYCRPSKTKSTTAFAICYGHADASEQALRQWLDKCRDINSGIVLVNSRHPDEVAITARKLIDHNIVVSLYVHGDMGCLSRLEHGASQKIVDEIIISDPDSAVPHNSRAFENTSLTIYTGIMSSANSLDTCRQPNCQHRNVIVRSQKACWWNIPGLPSSESAPNKAAR